MLVHLYMLFLVAAMLLLASGFTTRMKVGRIIIFFTAAVLFASLAPQSFDIETENCTSATTTVVNDGNTTYTTVCANNHYDEPAIAYGVGAAATIAFAMFLVSCFAAADPKTGEIL